MTVAATLRKPNRHDPRRWPKPSIMEVIADTDLLMSIFSISILYSVGYIEVAPGESALRGEACMNNALGHTDWQEAMR